MPEEEGKTTTETKNVFIGKNLGTSKPYFERRKVRVTTPEENIPPSIDELPPFDEEGNPVLQKSLEEAMKNREK